MKRFNRYLGLVMASSLLLSMTACTITSGTAETEAPAAFSSSSTAVSEETSASSETTESQTKSNKSLDDDLFNMYADPTYTLPKEFLANISDHDATWYEWLDICLGNGTVLEHYEVNDKTVADAKWKISQAERVNDYSFKIKITDLVSSNFSDITYPEEYCRLNKGDELIIYLPNAPTDDIAFVAYAAAAYKSGQPDDPQRRLQAFCVYNPASNGACRILMHGLLVSEKTSPDDMKIWYGEYLTESGNKVKIYDDPSTREPRVDLTYAGSKQCNGMQVRKVTDDPSELYAFGKAGDGTVIVIGLNHSDEGYSMSVYKSAEGDEDKNFGQDTSAHMIKQKQR